MSPSLSNPTEFPIEILEQILLLLPSQDIVKTQSVNRHLRDLIRNLPTLQHRWKLFATGLIDNPYSPCNMTERRKLREGYAHKWSNAVKTVKSRTQKLPPSQFSGWNSAKYLGNGHIVSYLVERNGPTFLHIPSAASRKPIESWTLPPPSFTVFDYAVYSPENVIAVANGVDNSIHIHLLNFRDGSPHYPPPANVITWVLPPGTQFLINHGMAITGSRVMITVSHLEENMPRDREVWRIAVWDWKTGDLVFHLPSTDESGLCGENTLVNFLDEFRMVVLVDKSDVTELIVFNTLIPQSHLGNSRRLGLPRPVHHWAAKIHIDHDRPLGTPTGDESLIADPTQAVLFLELTKNWGPQVFLVVRTQALIEQTCSTRANPYLPWDEWGMDSVVMESLIVEPRIFVHGAQVMVVQWLAGGLNFPGWYYNIQTFDFSRRGRSSLPLWGGEGCGTERTARFEDKGGIRFEPGDEMGPLDELRSLSDGNLFYIGTSGEGNNLDATLQVWELI